jgi:hypothetical protein
MPALIIGSLEATSPKPPTVNSKVRDWLLRNSHYTHRFENSVIREMMRHYAVARNEIMTTLRHGAEGWAGHTRDFRLNRLKSMLDDVQATMEFANVNATSTLDESLKAFGIAHSEGLTNEMTKHFPSHVGVAFTQIPLAHVFEIVGEEMLGETFGERMLWNNQQNVRKIRDRLTQSVIQGEDMGQASRRLFGSGKWMTGVIGKDAMMRAEMIARTEIQRVSNAVTRKIYEENQDVIKGIQYTATLDRRTCIICGSDDGAVYYYGRKGISRPKVTEPISTKFTPAKDVKGAEDWARKNLLAAPVKGRTLPASHIDYSGIKDVKVANRINEQLFSLQQKYTPRYAAIRTRDFKPDLLGNTVAAQTKTMKFADRSLTELQLNKNVFKDPNSVRSFFKNMPSGMFEDATARGIITHEYGHLLSHAKPKDIGKIDKIYNNWTKTNMMSKYASHSAGEMAAEGFVVFQNAGLKQLQATGLGGLEKIFNQWRVK